MPLKRRVSKARNPLITSEAVELFKRGLELQKIGADDVDFDGDDSTQHSEERLEYIQLTKRLHWTLFGLVGVAGPLDVFPGDVPSGAELYRQSYPHALELRRQLMTAMRRGKSSHKLR
jgi:hypothetical protein